MHFSQGAECTSLKEQDVLLSRRPTRWHITASLQNHKWPDELHCPVFLLPPPAFRLYAELKEHSYAPS